MPKAPRADAVMLLDYFYLIQEKAPLCGKENACSVIYLTFDLFSLAFLLP